VNVYLFDIDGTLMLSGGAGLRSMNRVFFERYGLHDAFDGFQFQGKVDPAIFREALLLHDIKVADPDAEIPAMIREYESYIAAEMPHSQTATIYPGVRELLERLGGRDDLSIGLLTGNVRGGALAKLSSFDLWKFFPYGAFGSDHEQREKLVPIALERASRHLGRTIEPGPHVYVIGDTDRDVACALANDCTAVGVGTLNFSAARLKALGAHVVCEDFSETENVLKQLGVNHG